MKNMHDDDDDKHNNNNCKLNSLIDTTKIDW